MSEQQEPQNFWRTCSACKKNIPFGAKYFVCSVSTCNGLRTGYVFCSIMCWDSHVGEARHRGAGAVEKLSPLAADSATPPAGENSPGGRRFIAKTSLSQSQSSGSLSQSSGTRAQAPRDVLIVASKLKDYIRLRSEMNTSASVLDKLSDIVRQLCDDAIDRARAEGRKTVMDRDFDIEPD